MSFRETAASGEFGLTVIPVRMADVGPFAVAAPLLKIQIETLPALESAGAQLSLKMVFPDRRAAHAQGVVGRDGVEIEIRQRIREEKGLWRQRERSRNPTRRRGVIDVERLVDFDIHRLAGMAVDFIRGNRFQSRQCPCDHGLQAGEGLRADQ